jgi:hypothetical protein
MVSGRASGFSRVITVVLSHCPSVPSIVQRICCIQDCHGDRERRLQLVKVRDVGSRSLMGRVTRRVGYPHYCGVSAGSRQLFTHRVHLKAININLRLYTASASRLLHTSASLADVLPSLCAVLFISVTPDLHDQTNPPTSFRPWRATPVRSLVRICQDDEATAISGVFRFCDTQI